MNEIIVESGINCDKCKNFSTEFPLLKCIKFDRYFNNGYEARFFEKYMSCFGKEVMSHAQ